jgi:hypothetical protein
MGQDLVLVVQRDPEHGPGKDRCDCSFKFYWLIITHIKTDGPLSIIEMGALGNLFSGGASGQFASRFQIIMNQARLTMA